MTTRMCVTTESSLVSFIVAYSAFIYVYSQRFLILLLHVKGMNGISPIPDGYNPATWMLEVSTPAAEERLGIDFAETYKSSDQFR